MVDTLDSKSGGASRVGSSPTAPTTTDRPTPCGAQPGLGQRLSDYLYDLPSELIAQRPAAQRTESRLLVVEPAATRVASPTEISTQFSDLRFADILGRLQAGDLLVVNNSRVIPARLQAQKETGGQVELLVEEIQADGLHALCMMRASRKPTAGARLRLPGDRACWLVGRSEAQPDRFLIRFEGPVLSVLEACGELPLPPYIEHSPDGGDAERYQTVYAGPAGSVAAPTAGLHFDEALLEELAARGVRRADVTLHVGSGTFAPVKHEDLSLHTMHREWCSVPEATTQAIAETRQRGGQVIAVGTTSLRTLESAALRTQAEAPELWAQGLLLPGDFSTELFVRPGFRFSVVDRLITNFHLPGSTLLMLVSAFAGYGAIRAAYAHAVSQRYRFFSYGDAMLLSRAPSPR